MGRRRRSWLLTVGTVALAALLAVSLAVVPAFGQATVQDQSPVQASVMVQDPGRLVSNGVAADITVEYECLPGVTLDFLVVSVRERFGRKIAQGFGFVEGGELGTCLGFVPQFVTVRVFADSTPFKPGNAIVTAELFGFDQFFEFISVSDEREIRLSKNKKK